MYKYCHSSKYRRILSTDMKGRGCFHVGIKTLKRTTFRWVNDEMKDYPLNAPPFLCGLSLVLGSS